MKDTVHNYIVFTWHGRFNRWVQRNRYSTPQEAAQEAASWSRTAVVIDLVSGRMIWQKGNWCSRVRPAGIKSLPPIEKYQEQVVTPTPTLLPFEQ